MLIWRATVDLYLKIFCFHLGYTKPNHLSVKPGDSHHLLLGDDTVGYCICPHLSEVKESKSVMCRQKCRSCNKRVYFIKFLLKYTNKQIDYWILCYHYKHTV